MAMTSILREKQSTAEAPRPVVRKPKWKFESTDVVKDLHENVFYRTYIAGLSLLFPEGERFFIRAVKAHRDKIDDPKLQEDIKAFIGQEAQHGALHERLNRVALGKEYETESFVEQWTKLAFGYLESWADKYLPDSITVSVTAAAEHFTAAWAVHALKAPLFQSIENDEVRDLINWHAVEEIEHKHVAFDVMRAVDDSYLTRAAGMLIGGPAIGILSGWAAIHLLRQEEKIDWKQFIETLMHESTDKNGMLRIYFEAFLSYFKPGFHPSDDMSEYELAAEVSEYLEGRLESAS